MSGDERREARDDVSPSLGWYGIPVVEYSRSYAKLHE